MTNYPTQSPPAAGAETLGATLNTYEPLTFNRNTFIICTTLVGFLLILSFLAAWAEDEGTVTPDDMFWYFFARLFYILRFPTHTLFWGIIIKLDGWAFIAGLAINCIFYGLLFERIISFVKKISFKDNDN